MLIQKRALVIYISLYLRKIDVAVSYINKLRLLGFLNTKNMWPFNVKINTEQINALMVWKQN